MGLILGDLDFLYMPSRDVAADVADLVAAFGAQVIFAIDDGGTRVAMLELTESPPRILLTDHLDGDRPILVYRVADHAAATAELQSDGWLPERSLEIPQGPVSSYRSTGGHRVAIYESTRPGVLAHFEGRRDF
ncbi:MAG: hypothetical protein ACJ77Y_14395 [Chloroflexota bacterium]|jgi:hypothetical protein